MDTPKTSAVALPKSRRGLKGFWTEVVRELKKVDWPVPKEVNRLTGVVIAVCAIVVGVLYVMSLLAQTVVNIMTGK